MTDRREAILERLVEIAEDLGTFATVGRNIADLPDEALPALILMDGDEEADDQVKQKGRPAHGPNIVRMTPSLHAVVSGSAGELGPAMNDIRAKLIREILFDNTLTTLCHNGQMSYDACATGMFGDGERLIAEIGVSFTFEYVLRPSEFDVTA